MMRDEQGRSKYTAEIPGRTGDPLEFRSVAELQNFYLAALDKNLKKGLKEGTTKTKSIEGTSGTDIKVPANVSAGESGYEERVDYEMGLTTKDSTAIKEADFTNIRLTDQVTSPVIHPVTKDLLSALDTLDVNIPINSAFRTEKHNKKVKGVEGSLHTRGLAIDIAGNKNDDNIKRVEEYIANNPTIEYKGKEYTIETLYHDGHLHIELNAPLIS